MTCLRKQKKCVLLLWKNIDEVGRPMFEKMKERSRQRQEERERQIIEEKNRLLSLSEKELLVEILLELKRVEDRVDDVERSVRIYSN